MSEQAAPQRKTLGTPRVMQERRFWHTFSPITERAALVPSDGSGVQSIQSHRSTASTYWAEDSPTLALGTFSEKQHSLGEDAEPTFLASTDEGSGQLSRCLVGVYDGLGGSGARSAGRRFPAGTTQAYVASREVRRLVEKWYVEMAYLPSGAPSHLLEQVLRQQLGELEREIESDPSVPKSRIRSRMQRAFPTTLAAIDVRRSTTLSTDWSVRALWAGDSRCFVWSAKCGLQQLSRDHARDSDAMRLQENDAPMTNVVSAESDWFIDHHPFVGVPEPFFLMCTSDGVHGYVATPGLLEYQLTKHLADATSMGDWASRLSKAIAGYTADDATLAGAGIGFRDFHELQTALTQRLEMLERTQHTPFDGMEANSLSLRTAQESSWEAYRGVYERHLPSETRSTTQRSVVCR